MSDEPIEAIPLPASQALYPDDEDDGTDVADGVVITGGEDGGDPAETELQDPVDDDYDQGPDTTEPDQETGQG